MHDLIMPWPKRSLRSRVFRLLANTRALAVSSLIVFFVCLYISYRVVRDAWWQGLWTDLGVTALGVLVTVALVNVALDAESSYRWEGVKVIAEDRLRVTTARLMMSVTQKDPDVERLMKFDVSMEIRRMYSHRYWEHFLRNDGWKEYIIETVIPEIDSFLTGSPPEIVEKMRLEFELARDNYQNAIIVFNPVLDPEKLVYMTDINKWIYETLTEPYWEGADITIPFFVANVLKSCVSLVESLEPTPEPLHFGNDPRYAEIREEYARRRKEEDRQIGQP